MKPPKPNLVEPDPIDFSDPFNEPRTIPAGWDVSAFLFTAAEQDNQTYYDALPTLPLPTLPLKPHERTKDTF
jgi:hypothetical protein